MIIVLKKKTKNYMIDKKKFVIHHLFVYFISFDIILLKSNGL
jgi:hypothetical protein